MGGLLLAAVLGGSPLGAQTTRPERTQFRETSTHADVLAFLDSLQKLGAGLRIGTLGSSPQGRRIPYVIAARPMVDSPGPAHRSGKPILYIQGNIHAGEVEGKEALQMLLRDLTLGTLRPLLDSVILIVVPIYNTDGNDDLAPGEKNRPGQNGPAIVGRNTNGQGLNLNRDYVKLEAPETRGALALLAEWEPDFFIDLHTTNGSYHGYALTYAPGLNPNSGPANDYVRDHFLPLVRERMRKRHKEETFWYGNFRNQTPDSLVQGWETYDPRPRFGTNEWGLKGRLAILSEGYSNAPFKDRIEATYNFVREILSLAAEERTRVRAVVDQADAWLPDSITLHSVLGPPTQQEVIAEITEPADEGNGGFARRKRSGVYKTIRMPVFDRFVPALRDARPAAYVIPSEHADLVALLRAQGVIVFKAGAWRGNAERFTVDSVNLTTTVFEGHRAVGLVGRWASAEVAMPDGWFYVPTSQRLGVFASYMLEPMSEDGFVTWNFLDRDIAVGSPFPITRVRQPLVAPMEMVQ